MPYYVVNARTARGVITNGTHIMQSNNSNVPGIVSGLAISNVKRTFCGRDAGRYVDVFQAAEASCRECRKRWQLAARNDALEAERRAELTPEQRHAEDIAKAGQKVGGVIMVAIFCFVLWLIFLRH